MRIKIVKCEARNAVNIGNIDKFRAVGDSASFPEELPAGCNEAIDDFKLKDAGYDLFRSSPAKSDSYKWPSVT